MGDWDRALTTIEQETIAAAREACRLRYEGVVVPHRSCGIALAETFGRPTPAYQSLRRGGLTGKGECGTAVAGRLLLGEILGDPDPGGAVTPLLRSATLEYEARWGERAGVPGDRVCNTLVAPFPDFMGAPRARMCAALAAETAALVAEVLLRNDQPVQVTRVGGG